MNKRKRRKQKSSLCIADKLFVIFFLILLFLSFGIAGNIELEVPTPMWAIVLYFISVFYCGLRILIFDLYNK